MLKDISKFQLIIIGIFVFFTIAGLAVFALYRGGASQETPLVTIWGTLDSTDVTTYIQQVNYVSGNKIRITYVQKTPVQFDSDLLEALATGKGPDAILVSQNELLKQSNKIFPISYNTLPQDLFRSTFVQEGELFLTSQGILAYPFAIDPMVMYWNRDIFTNANISVPPKHWDEFLTLTPTLTKKDAALNITQSTVALGEYRNIDHAKDIISLLMMQAGNPIGIESNGSYQSTLSSNLNYTVAPANSALTFYTQFADPLKSTYTWNRALPSSKTLFLSNKLSIYFGYASEYQELRDKNPNLNFDVVSVPQLRPQPGTQQTLMTYGNVYGFALMRTSSTQKLQAAFTDISLLTSKGALAMWTKISGLPSVRRDALAINPSNVTSGVFATAALQARGWLDPDRNGTERIFMDMVEGITSGRQQYVEAISNAQGQLQTFFDTINQNKSSQ